MWGRLFYKCLQTYLIFPPFISVFNAHWKKRYVSFARYSTRHGAGRVIHIQLWLLPKYICIIHFRRFDYFANFAVSRQNNLIYDAEEKNGLFAATSATRVIIFAVRISFLLRSQWDVDRQPYSWKRQPRFDCALFSVPVPYYVSGGFSCLVFIVFIITFCS